ncbi:MAG: hypothetical protein ACLTDF_12480 [Coprococcus sp.]
MFFSARKFKVAEKDNKIEAPAAGDVVDYLLNSDDVDQYINMDKMEKMYQHGARYLTQ